MCHDYVDPVFFCGQSRRGAGIGEGRRGGALMARCRLGEFVVVILLAVSIISFLPRPFYRVPSGFSGHLLPSGLSHGAPPPPPPSELRCFFGLVCVRVKRWHLFVQHAVGLWPRIAHAGLNKL